MLTPRGVSREALFLPMGWDTEKRINLLKEGPELPDEIVQPKQRFECCKTLFAKFLRRRLFLKQTYYIDHKITLRRKLASLNARKQYIIVYHVNL